MAEPGLNKGLGHIERRFENNPGLVGDESHLLGIYPGTNHQLRSYKGLHQYRHQETVAVCLQPFTGCQRKFL